MTVFHKVLVDATAVAFHLHHRDILDAIAPFLSAPKQLGAEKPALVLNLWDDRGCPVVCLVYRTQPMANECKRRKYPIIMPVCWENSRLVRPLLPIGN
jgi:hypothetical protein